MSGRRPDRQNCAYVNFASRGHRGIRTHTRLRRRNPNFNASPLLATTQAVRSIRPHPAGNPRRYADRVSGRGRSVATPHPWGCLAKAMCPSPVKCHALPRWCSARAGYRAMKKAGSAINRTIKQTKAAISTLLPSCLSTDRGFRRGFLTYDTRANGQKFNRVHRIAPLVGGGGGAGTARAPSGVRKKNVRILSA